MQSILWKCVIFDTQNTKAASSISLKRLLKEFLYLRNYFFAGAGAAAGFSASCFLQQAASFFLQHDALPWSLVQDFAHSFLSPAITEEAAKNKAKLDNKNTFFILTKILEL